MPLEIRCPNCGKTLRVGEEHSGKQVRCPACQQVSIAPASGEGFAPSLTLRRPSANPELATWHMRTPEGQTYGPVSWNELKLWVGEGRLAADCLVADSPAGPWHGAAEYFPGLTPVAPGPVVARPPVTHDWLPPGALQDETAPFATPSFAAQPGTAAGGQFVVPHRGGLILVLGVLGFAVSCPVFCLMAWVMGSSDLRLMRSGRMDRSGEGLTQVGQVLGMIMSLLWIFGGMAMLLVILLAAVNGA